MIVQKEMKKNIVKEEKLLHKTKPEQHTKTGLNWSGNNNKQQTKLNNFLPASMCCSTENNRSEDQRSCFSMWEQTQAHEKSHSFPTCERDNPEL